MTGQERLEYLVGLGMEAYDAAEHGGYSYDEKWRADDRADFKQRLTERMAQAAQVWTIEASEHR